MFLRLEPRASGEERRAGRGGVPVSVANLNELLSLTNGPLESFSLPDDQRSSTRPQNGSHLLRAPGAQMPTANALPSSSAAHRGPAASAIRTRPRGGSACLALWAPNETSLRMTRFRARIQSRCVQGDWRARNQESGHVFAKDRAAERQMNLAGSIQIESYAQNCVFARFGVARI